MRAADGSFRTRPDIVQFLQVQSLAESLRIPHISLRSFTLDDRQGNFGARDGDGMSSNGTLTRADLAESVNRHIGLSRAEASGIVESILDHMSEALARGENVKISSFGTFVLRDKNERMGRNPKTGVEVPIDPRRVLTFRASQSMRDRVSGS
jgi:integration host factor subunit alpha